MFHEKGRQLTGISRQLFVLSIPLFLLAACTYGGIGFPTSPAWKRTASQEDQERYYRDHANSKVIANPESKEDDSQNTFQSEIIEASKNCDAIVRSVYPADASQDDIAQDKYPPNRGGVAKIFDCVTEQQKPVWKKYYPAFADLYETSRAKVAVFAENYDNGDISYKKFVAKEKHEEVNFNNNVHKRRASIDKENTKRAEREQKEAIAEQKAAEAKAKKEAREQIKQEKAYAAKLKREQLAADKATCRDYGIQRGTKEFSACLIQVVQARQQQAEQQKAQAQMLQEQQLAQEQQQAAQQQRAAQAAAQHQQACLLAMAQANMQPTRTGSPWESLNNSLITMNQMGCQ